MQLAVNQEWVNHFAAVINRNVTEKLYVPGFAIYLDRDNMCAKRKRKILRLEKASGGKTRLCIRGKLFCKVRCERNILNGHPRFTFRLWLGQSPRWRFTHWHHGLGRP